MFGAGFSARIHNFLQHDAVQRERNYDDDTDRVISLHILQNGFGHVLDLHEDTFHPYAFPILNIQANRLDGHRLSHPCGRHDRDGEQGDQELIFHYVQYGKSDQESNRFASSDQQSQA